MRVLWLCNICLPVIAEKLGIPSSSKEGWLTGLSGALVTYGENNKLELAVCFPLKTATPGTFQKGMVSGMTYYAFYEDVAKETVYEKITAGVLKMSHRPNPQPARGATHSPPVDYRSKP